MSQLENPRAEDALVEDSPNVEGEGGGGSEAIAMDDIHHDIYFVAPDEVLYKFPVDDNGSYTLPPRTPAYSEPNLRHIHNLANPAVTEEEPRPRGPVFATLPVTAEPSAASIVTCYVINPNNLIYRNAYTAEEWFSPGAEERPGPTIPDDFDLIVAGPRGRIYHLEVRDGGETATCKQLSHDELKVETEVWDQLRNGTVVGRVLFREEIVPLVNVTSVQPERKQR